MTPRDVRRVARACNMKLIGIDDCVTLTMLTEQLERFAELVSAFEREACAQICLEMRAPACLEIEGVAGHQVAALECAKAIRARGEK